MTPVRPTPPAGTPRGQADGGATARPDEILQLLVVDDDVVDRMAVRRMLRQTSLADARIEESADAAAALVALSRAGVAGNAAYDCVLLDFDLSGTTGLDVLRRMSALGLVLPVVVLTGRSDPETAAALIKAGASDFLTKGSLTPERLEQSIRGAVRVARAERALQESRARLAITLRSIADAVITLDGTGSVTYMNAAAERLTGWPAAEATGRRLDEVAFVVGVDEGAAQLQETLLHERVQRVLGGQRADERADMTLVARDGTQLYVDATVTQLRDGTAAATGAVVALRDISERKRAEAALAAANRELQAQAQTLEQQARELEQQFEESQALTAELEQVNEHLLEAHLRTERSETRYRALINASTQLIWSTDPDGHTEDLPDWRALTGQTVEEVRGDGWLAAVHPDDRERSARVWREAFDARRTYETEYRLRLADGSHRWYRARGVPVLDADGAVREWVGTLADVDEERRTEEARREEASLVETLHDIGGVLTSELDVERIVQTVTDAATSLTGAQFGAFFYSVVDAHGEKLTLYTLSGAPREAFQDFGHPRATPVFSPTFHGTTIVRSDDIMADPRYGQMEPHHGMPPGHLPVRSYLAVPVISRNGEVIGGLFFGHADVGVFTQRAERLVSGIASSASIAMDNARLYQAERRARADAELANKSKSDFLANMSHELRTPLNAIGGFVQLLAMELHGPVTDEQRQALERVEGAQRRLLALINDILNFAKLESGTVVFDLRPVDLHKLVAEIVPLLGPQMAQKGLTLDVRLPTRPWMVRADRDKLGQVLMNLLSNATKFTDARDAVTGAPGRVTVDIVTPGHVSPTVRRAVAAIGTAVELVCLRVSDTGIGIPADKLETIFEPFVQVRAGYTQSPGGAGLGLAISRDLARGMGGDLVAESVAGRGSTFTALLPQA